MPPTIKNITALGNVRDSSRGDFYTVTYRDEVKDPRGWLQYDMSADPPHSLPQPQVWYRTASAERRVEVTYKMRRPLPFINGKYRIEVFVPDKHASVTKARFAVTAGFDEAGVPVETPVTVNMLAASNEWVPLGEFTLDLGTLSDPCTGAGSGRRRRSRLPAVIGQVRQFDDTDEVLSRSHGRSRGGGHGGTPAREISFGPVRWVPLYQLADTSYAKLDPADHAQIEYLVDTRSDPAIEAAWSAPLTVFDGVDTRREWQVKWRRRSTARQLQVSYTPPGPLPPGRYRVEAFVPAVSLTRSSGAPYTVKTAAQVVDGQKTYREVAVSLDQSRFANQWVPLCPDDFVLEPDPAPGADGGSLVGQVSQFDDTADLRNIFITFGPVRWVPRFEVEVKPSLQFDFPMGESGQRHAKIETGLPGFGGGRRWLEDWVDSNPFLTPYDLGIHTGADINKTGAEDLGSPLFAAGDGRVWFEGKGVGSWGNIIVIEHPLAWIRLLDGRKVQGKVYTRYGHVLDEPGHAILVEKDQPVLKGDPIGFVGRPNVLNGGPHLHFDICYTDTLGTNPDHWPAWSGLKQARAKRPLDPADVRSWERKIQALVRQDYLDPFQFFLDNH